MSSYVVNGISVEVFRRPIQDFETRSSTDSEDMPLAGPVRTQNALKQALEGQITPSFQRIALKYVRKAQNKPLTEPGGQKLTEIQ